ncbi:MAG TPA: galactokinase [Terriglobia bacterium]|nr:galactokinase [Terriglobia bacterium]
MLKTPSSHRDEAKSIKESFRQVFGQKPEMVVRAPGRVNLIGEHTDYNQGFVLPAAIDRYVWYAGRKRPDRTVRVYSVDFEDQTDFDLDNFQKDEQHAWSNYLRGVSGLLESGGAQLPGVDLVLGGNVPPGAGLSSSAAVEIGAAVFWTKLLNRATDPLAIIKLAQKAENDFVGVPSGIMDQFASALGKADHALFLDCRDLTCQYVPLDPKAKIVVCNSGVKRALAQSEYEVRVRQCQEAVAGLRSAGLKASSLRDVEPAQLEAARGGLTEIQFRRARHVVTENQRVLKAIEALEAGNLDEFGKLMNQSHESLRDDYEVSSRELDALAELAWKQPGVYGARMTGAGFGGCTVNLVRQESAAAFVEAVCKGYEKVMGAKPEIYVFRASDGALAAREDLAGES